MIDWARHSIADPTFSPPIPWWGTGRWWWRCGSHDVGTSRCVRRWNHGFCHFRCHHPCDGDIDTGLVSGVYDSSHLHSSDGHLFLAKPDPPRQLECTRRNSFVRGAFAVFVSGYGPVNSFVPGARCLAPRCALIRHSLPSILLLFGSVGFRPYSQTQFRRCHHQRSIGFCYESWIGKSLDFNFWGYATLWICCFTCRCLYALQVKSFVLPSRKCGGSIIWSGLDVLSRCRLLPSARSICGCRNVSSVGVQYCLPPDRWIIRIPKLRSAPWLDQCRRELRQSRSRSLGRMGWESIFLLWPECRITGGDSSALRHRVLDNDIVAVPFHWQ